MRSIKRVLLVYTDPYYLVKQVYPYGLDLLAQRLRREGLEVRLEHAFLPSSEPSANLAAALEGFSPDLAGISIRNLDTTMACEEFGDYQGPGFRSFHFLPQVGRVVDALRGLLPQGVPLICGGGGFSVAPEEILAYLELPYGIVGEGEEPLARFVRAWPDEGALKDIPGLVRIMDGKARATPRAPFSFEENDAYGREPGFAHAFEAAGLPLRVKRGCNQVCSFCVEPLIEGGRFIYREPAEVVAELWAASGMEQVRKVFFVDTEFNLPDAAYAKTMLRAIIDAGLPERFRFASQFLPAPFDEELAGLLAEAGFSLIVTATSFSDAALTANGASYSEADILRCLELCRDRGIDATFDLIFGLPGETFDTVRHTCARMRENPDDPLTRYEYTVGARIYPGTPLARRVVREGPEQVHGRITPGLLEPVFYCSPTPPLELKAFVDELVPSPMRFANELSETRRGLLAVGYLADHGRFKEAYDAWLALDLPGRAAAFERFGRIMANAGYPDAAAQAAASLRQAILESGDPELRQGLGIVEHYLMLFQGAG
jgi:radical SAM superfamily enzyme YgiQ (UPF0313 family)